MLDGITQLLSSVLDIASTLYGILVNIISTLISFFEFALTSIQFIANVIRPEFFIGGVFAVGITVAVSGIVLRIVVDLL